MCGDLIYFNDSKWFLNFLKPDTDQEVLSVIFMFKLSLFLMISPTLYFCLVSLQISNLVSPKVPSSNMSRHSKQRGGDFWSQECQKLVLVEIITVNFALITLEKIQHNLHYIMFSMWVSSVCVHVLYVWVCHEMCCVCLHSETIA